MRRLKEIVSRSGRTVAQLAIAWVLANPAMTSAIIRVRTPDHFLSALPATSCQLDAETLHEIDAALDADQAAA